VEFILYQIEGEKDVRNFNSVIKILEIIISNINKDNLRLYRSRIFESLSIYFPITSKKMSNKLLIDNNLLIDGLVEFFTCNFPKEFENLINEKLRVKEEEELVNLLASIKALNKLM